MPLNSVMLGLNVFAPAHGTYIYPSGPADNDGADIFRAAVGLTPKATIWRVDWNTLVDPSVPIAEWTFDTDNNAHTGASTWPADANVSSPGIKKALVVSAKGAELINAVTGKTIASFPTSVDMASQSFLVTIPRSVMPVRGAWRVRLAAGLANSTGSAFAVPTLSGGQSAPSTAPRVYNVTFRTVAQEPHVYTDAQTDTQIARLRAFLHTTPVLGAYGIDEAATSEVVGNYWGENDQADTLATGDVSKFSVLVRWSQLAAKRTTAPPLVKGYSDRWYVTRLSLGNGINTTTNSSTQDTAQATPNFLSRVQPYAVYVPANYTGRKALPLTLLLHDLDTNYNRYGGISPRLVQELCHDRDSICVTPEGFGPAGGWAGPAEYDFWEVWRQMALHYRIDPNRTVIGGYSMGGAGTYRIGETYPSDFSEALSLDGAFDTGCAKVSSLNPSTPGYPPSNMIDRSANVHWDRYVISSSVADEGSPPDDALTEEMDFETADNRFASFHTTFPDHIETAATDGFSTQIAALDGAPAALTGPGTINYTWCPNVVDSKLGLGPTSVYWLSGLTQRSSSTSSAQIVAGDQAIPTPPETETTDSAAVNPPDAPPMVETTGSWQPGVTPAAARVLTLTLTDVGSLTVDTVAAKLPHGSATVTADGATQLTLAGLPPGTIVHAGTAAYPAGSGGSATVPLPAGTATLSW
jgi:pimeloyl-ACP methyl ester carboxylesterase